MWRFDSGLGRLLVEVALLQSFKGFEQSLNVVLVSSGGEVFLKSLIIVCDNASLNVARDASSGETNVL